MAPHLRVSGGPAPVLDEEEGQALGGAGQVRFGIDRAEDGIRGHPRVEPPDQLSEDRLAAGGLENIRRRGFSQGVIAHSPTFCR